MDNQSQPEYIDDWYNPESVIEKQKSSKQHFFDQFLYRDESLNLMNFIAPNLSPESRMEVTLKPYDERRKYLTVHCGLNIKGTCKNEKCIGYHKNVWIKKDYGKIIFSQAIFGNQCPCCNTEMDYTSFKSLGFKKAKVTFQGARIINNKPQKFSRNDEEKVGKFILFKDYDEHVCEWIFLNITVQKN